MLFQGQVAAAVAAVRASGNPNATQLQLGELGISQVLPKYGALAWSGLVYYAANTAAQALSVVSGTFTGLAVGNPANSGKNLVLLDASVAIAAAIAVAGTIRLGWAPVVALTTGNSTGPKGAPVLAGTSGSSVATVGASCTFGASPTTLRVLCGIHWVTGNVTTAQIYAKDEIAGAIIIPPGQAVGIDALVGANTAAASLTWAELPI